MSFLKHSIKNVLNKLLSKQQFTDLINFINSLKSLVSSPVFLTNYFRRDYTKKVLLVYITFPFTTENQYSHQNYVTVKYIAKIFDSLKFQVDIIDCSNNRSQIDYSIYDVIFGFGAPFENSFNFDIKAKRVMLVTGVHNELQNKMCLLALNDFKKITNIWSPQNSHVIPCNYFSHYKSDEIIILANGYVKQDFEERLGRSIHSLNNNILGIWSELEEKKNINKDNLLFIFGNKLIKKGIHIVIEYIKLNSSLNYKLVVSESDLDMQEYLATISKLPNVEIHTSLPMNSDKFIDLIEECAFIVSPSYADGMPGAVIEPMSRGLIPIVTKYCGFPEDSKIFINIEGLSIHDLADAIDKARSLSDEELINMSKRVRAYALNNYNVNTCEQQFMRIINEL